MIFNGVNDKQLKNINADKLDGYHAEEFLQTTGGTLSNYLWGSNDGKGFASFAGGGNNAYLEAWNTGKNARRQIRLANPDIVANDSDSLALGTIKSDGTYVERTILHTGNGLPLTGGTLSGTLSLAEYLTVYSSTSDVGVHSDFIQNANGTHARHTTDTNNFDEVFIKQGNITYAKMVNGAWSESEMLHTGNKPRGTYIGNGDTTERKIETGGIGDVAFVGGGGYGAIVTPNGAIYTASTGSSFYALKRTECNFTNGVLTIATTHAGVNNSGIEFTYQVL